MLSILSHLRTRLAAKGAFLAGAAATLGLLAAVAGQHDATAQSTGQPPAAAAAPSAAADKSLFTPEQQRAIEQIVKDYLIQNPEVFVEVQTAFEANAERIQAERIKAVIASSAAEIYRHPDAPVTGNPKGDITIVEFFDYNCGYCKKSFPGLLKLIDSDANVRVALMEFPILAKESEEASRVALAARLQGKYWEVHRALIEQRGPASEASALKVAEKLGLDMERLKKDMTSEPVSAEINRVRALAQKLGIQATPHFMVGQHVIAGYPPDLYSELSGQVSELRKSGCQYC